LKLVDTVVVVGCFNPKDRLQPRCVQQLRRIVQEGDVFVPAVVLIETDLVMKVRGYDLAEREVSWRALEDKIPQSKIIVNSISSIFSAMELQRQGMEYFDSLISSLALETDSIVITTDKAIDRIARTEW
jgi:predicted nucleic-acid-binding protein